MELLQRLTLYDLLGYTLPGAILLIVVDSGEMNRFIEEGTLSGLIIFIAVAYVAGIIISELASWVKAFIQKYREKCQKEKSWEKFCADNDITVKKIRTAMINAHMLDKTAETAVDIEKKKVKDSVYARERMQAMYADIQCDPRYSRIHNYASAVHLYKNMAFVSFVCTILGIFEYNVCKSVIWGVCTIGFCVRCERFSKKKHEYTVLWFLQKYDRYEE